MNPSQSTLRKSLALAGFIVVTFCAPLLGIFGKPGVWYAALNKPAGWMLVPYLAWVTFAAFLNFTLWQMNPL